MAYDNLSSILGLPLSGRKIIDPGENDPYMDPAVRLASLRKQRAEELSSYGTGPSAARELSSLEQDIAEDPYTGAAARQKVADIQDALAKAAMYERPEIAGPRREQQAFELRKEEAPARMAGEYGMRQAEEATRRAMEVEQEKQRGRTTAYGALIGALGGGLKPGAHLSLSDVGSVTIPGEKRAIDPGVLNKLAAARQNLAKAQQQSWWWQKGKEPEREQVRQLVAGAIANHPANEDVKWLARDILTDPTTKNMDVDSAIEAKGQTQLTDEEHSHLSELLQIYRGY
jgi:hypothetical protein